MFTCVVGAVGARADEPAEPPRTPPQGATAVIAAFEQGNSEVLTRLAATPQPDPWLVLDLLCEQGTFDAAEAFALAAEKRKAMRRGAYVTSRRTAGADTKFTEALKQIGAALRARDLEQALKISDGLPARLASVTQVRLTHARGIALRMARRLGQSASVLQRAAQGARDLGWLTKASTLFHQAALDAYRHADWKTALASWRARVEVARELDDARAAAESVGNVAVVHTRTENVPEALSAYEEALDLYEKLGDELGKARSLANLGHVHSSRGDDARARVVHERALKIMLKLGNKPGIAATTSSLGAIYGRMGDYPKALTMLERALTLQRELGVPRTLASMLGALGTIYKNLGDFERSLDYQRKSLALKEGVGDRAGVAAAAMNIGSALYHLDRVDESLVWQKRALGLFTELGDKRATASALDNIALVHTNTGAYEKALEVQNHL